MVLFWPIFPCSVCALRWLLVTVFRKILLSSRLDSSFDWTKGVHSDSRFLERARASHEGALLLFLVRTKSIKRSACVFTTVAAVAVALDANWWKIYPWFCFVSLLAYILAAWVSRMLPEVGAKMPKCILCSGLPDVVVPLIAKALAGSMGMRTGRGSSN